MIKKYQLDLTDDEFMHIMLACDAWSSEQKEKARKAHEQQSPNADKCEDRFSTSEMVMEKLMLSACETNPELNLKQKWQEIMFDV
jgi:hypothetical protein